MTSPDPAALRAEVREVVAVKVSAPLIKGGSSGAPPLPPRTASHSKRPSPVCCPPHMCVSAAMALITL